MSDAFQCHSESGQSVLEPRDGLVVTSHARSLEHPSSIEAKDETYCGFRDFTPEEKQNVKRLYAQRGRKHQLHFVFPKEECSR